jgi:hypothetical protein
VNRTKGGVLRKTTVLILLTALLFVLAGCGNGEAENGEETTADGQKLYPTAESLVDAFIKAANSQDKEVFYSLFYSEDAANAVWERVTESGLTFSPGYHIEDSSFGKHVIFDSARWEGYGAYEQQLYVSDELGPGWLINGQDYAFVDSEEEPGTEETGETGETTDQTPAEPGT